MTSKSRETIGNLKKMADEDERKNPRRKFIRVKEGVEKYNISRPTLMKLALESGAMIKIESTILLDDQMLEKYIESFRIPASYGGLL